MLSESIALLYIYIIYIKYYLVICIRRAFRRGTSATVIVQTNWSDFFFHLFILPRRCTSTFFVVFNEARTYINISVKTSRRYIKGILYYTPTVRLQSSNRFIIAPVARRTDFCSVMVRIIEIIF